MDALEKIPGSSIYFNTKLIGWDHQTGTCQFQTNDGKVILKENATLLATDGANSAARKELMNLSAQIRFNYKQFFQNYEQYRSDKLLLGIEVGMQLKCVTEIKEIIKSPCLRNSIVKTTNSA